MNSTKIVLLVEDDRIDVMTIQRVFKDLKIVNPLVVVSNGEEGLTFLNQMPPEQIGLILLDLNMPRMSGFEFLRMIKTRETYQHIPVVVLTTSSHEEDIHQAQALSVAGYIIKPVEYEQFVELIKTLHIYWSLGELSD